MPLTIKPSGGLPPRCAKVLKWVGTFSDAEHGERMTGANSRERSIMQYKVGRQGRIIVARFGDGDDVLGGLAEICKKEDLRAASFNLVGGMKRGRYVVGPETEAMPPVPVWRELDESHEAVGFGTIFWQRDEPKVHFHGAYGKHDSVKAGCLREGSEAFLVLEAVITEILDVDAVRELDPASGMVLLKLPE
jgi:predicted DNA-binding protein with PD1-like motif